MITISKERKVFIWTVTSVLSFVIFLAGFPKLIGGQDWAKNFELWGYPEWFRFFVGLVEVAGSILLLNQKTALFAAAVLMVVMAGATYTQIIFGEWVSWVIPLVLMALLASLVIARWPLLTKETGELNERVLPDNDDEESPIVAK
jgi:putative oxidoreductase